MKNLRSQFFYLAIATSMLAVIGQAQTVYVSNLGSGNVNAYTSSTTFTTIGNFSNPEGFAFDGAGNLYEAINGSNLIEKYTIGGGSSTYGTTTGQPISLTFDNSGNLYVLISGGNIQKITSGGGASTAFFTTGLSNPIGMLRDAAGNFYVSDYLTAGVINKYDSTGVFTSVFANTGMNHPQYMTFDNNGNLYVTNGGDDTIEKFGPAGGTGTVFETAPLPGIPAGIAFDSVNSIFYVPFSNNTVEMFGLAGNDLGTFTNVGLSNPNAIAISPIPEPASFATGVGIAVFGLVTWRRRRSRLSSC